VYCIILGYTILHKHYMLYDGTELYCICTLCRTALRLYCSCTVIHRVFPCQLAKLTAEEDALALLELLEVTPGATSSRGGLGPTPSSLVFSGVQ